MAAASYPPTASLLLPSSLLLLEKAADPVLGIRTLRGTPVINPFVLSSLMSPAKILARYLYLFLHTECSRRLHLLGGGIWPCRWQLVTGGKGMEGGSERCLASVISD